MMSTHAANILVSPKTRPEYVYSLIEEMLSQLQCAWDSDTCHASCKHASRPGSPVGQCYVSSMCIAQLLENFGIRTQINRGAVYSEYECLIEDHGWVEFFYHGQSWISDVTLHQLSGYSYIIMDLKSASGNIYKVSESRALANIDNEDVLFRHAILTSRLSNMDLGHA